MTNSGIKAHEIMTKEVVIAHPHMTVSEAAKLMNSFRIGGLPVIENGKLAGIITERDIMEELVAKDKNASETTVKKIMTSPPKIYGTENEDMNSIVKKMTDHNVTRMPIIDSANRLRGIITNKDVLHNCTEYFDVLLEQAKIKGIKEEDYTAFGHCETCGDSTHLVFKDGRFVCDDCFDKL
ncbi:CBS domain-containing protein [Candidatus Woesearchaeota archaeon]|nr:CBS domain-containing protein [Candidatus Woesearchaeota archaeon]